MAVPFLLECYEISKVYGKDRQRIEALKLVELSIADGEAVALMGPSGCGKSTLLGVLGLMVRPSSGRLLLHGIDVSGDERRRAQLRNEFFGYVHQEFAIIESETVEQNVMIPLEYAFPNVARNERRSRVQGALSHVGLEWAVYKRASHLSGGERQRVAIARALVNNPQLVLADEPTAALDSLTAQEIITLLLSVRQRGASVLVATHDPQVAARCDRVVRMVDGCLVLDGTDMKVLVNPASKPLKSVVRPDRGGKFLQS